MQKPALVVEKATNDSNYTQESQNLQEREGGVVVSINSDKYHYPDCPGADRIKEENKIYFASAAEAIEAGFILAGNCK
ncbi:MAG: hypothetical protein R3251_02200 [Candidatus Spechtbacterales bacterium]|nr:hypothetical protein [Candidatus Spechtbacterales bacterium]